MKDIILWYGKIILEDLATDFNITAHPSFIKQLDGCCIKQIWPTKEKIGSG